MRLSVGAVGREAPPSPEFAACRYPAGIALSLFIWASIIGSRQIQTVHQSGWRPMKSGQLILRVEKIALFLILSAVLLLIVGLAFMLVPILAFLAPKSNPEGLSNNLLSTLAGIALVGIVIFSLGMFVIRLAWDFRSFKRWTFEYVRFLARWSSVGFFIRDGLGDEEIREAFNQPEYEYPDMPEYGYKSDEDHVDKK